MSSDIKTPTDTSVHYLTLMSQKLELQKYLMKLLQFLPVHPFFHLIL